MEYVFKAKYVKSDIITWLRAWFRDNGPDCKAVIGISGGKDSSIAAALCVEALGADRVVGVLMPNVSQGDIEDSYELCKVLGIASFTIPVTCAVADTVNQITASGVEMTTQAHINLPARIRMATLYAVSQSVNGRVINTSNLSERMLGWCTRYGDAAGDVCPLGGLTCTEVMEIGDLLGLPSHLVHKEPSDGLTGKTDEENFGFTYKQVDAVIRSGECDDPEVHSKIARLTEKNAFKTRMPEVYAPQRCIRKQAFMDWRV